jgi:hypothetical protein
MFSEYDNMSEKSNLLFYNKLSSGNGFNTDKNVNKFTSDVLSEFNKQKEAYKFGIKEENDTIFSSSGMLAQT